MNKIRGFEIVGNKFKKNIGSNIILPTRGSKNSAGYDFHIPIDITIEPHQQILVWSDIKAYMQENEVLIIDIRSSIGIKKGLMIANTFGVIDSDYYSNSDNDGNIGLTLRNLTDEIVTINAGERVAQGIFIKYLVADNGNTNTKRTGGIGSTGTK